ncbi:hypothetical protein J6590_077609 [Homalodisca vitripennis]|nr:hypothetical protein J6590_077609 [Homalodisca vitripennis]
MAMISEVLGLKFKATVYHIGDGYFYYKKSTDRNKFYLRCAVSKLCPGRGNMPRQPEVRLASSLVTSRPHSHPPQPNWLHVNTLRTSILRRCETSSTPFRQIHREESERQEEGDGRVILVRACAAAPLNNKAIEAVRNEAVPDLEQRKQLEPDFQWWGRQTLSSLLSLSQ